MGDRLHAGRGSVQGTLLAALLAVALPGIAQQTNFDIPASTAAEAIPELARQAGIQIVAPGQNLAVVTTPAISGTMDLHDALGRLLEGTGLHIARDDGRTILLQSAATPSVPADAPATDGQDVAPGMPAAEQAAPDEAPLQQSLDQTQPPAENPKQLQAMVVTGSFIQRIDAETALPLTTMEQAEIDVSGAATVSDLLAQLPQAAEFDNSETSTGPNAARGDVASVNLRGLGSGNTLVLLNGHRIAPFPIASGAVPRLSANINQIPLGAVERIEVLRDGASATYGSDAVAGVVNAILKTDYDGAEINLRYGHVEDGGMAVRSGSILAGHNSEDGRTNVMGYLGFYDRNSLEARDKDYMQNGDMREEANSDSTRWDNRSSSGPYGIFRTGSVDEDGVFHPHDVPGTDDSYFHMAPGADGTDVGFGWPPRSLRYNFRPEYMLRPASRRYQLFGAFNHQFDNDLEAYATAFYYRADSYIARAASPVSASSDNDIYVPASNYWNPYGTRFYGPGTANPDTPASDVLIRNFRPVGLGRRGADVASRAYQFISGLKGRVGMWHWDVSAGYGEGKTTDHGLNMISESRLREQLALSTPEAFNPFGGPGGNTAEALDAVRITTWREGEAGLGTVDAKASGPVFELGGGSAQLAVGVQARHETFSDRRDPLSLADDVIAQSKSANADGSRDVYSGFAELYLPFFSDYNAVPGIQRLELSLAVRTEHYSDFGAATKPKVSIAWSPVSWLLLRGSRSEGFRAPTLAQVFVGEVIRRSTGIPDPYRADVVGNPRDLGEASRQVIRGGNPNLGPEEAKEHTIGVVFQPPFAENLSLSVDYFKIRQSDVISTYGQEEQLQLDFVMRTSGMGGNPDVVRLPVSDADRALFDAWNAAHPDDQRTPVGEVDYVRDTFINVARRTVSGVDFGLGYRLRDTPLGNFHLRSNVAYLDTFERQQDSASPSEGQLKINGLPRLRGLVGVTWSRKAFRAGLRANYIGSFYDTSAPRDENDQYYEVDSYTTFNGYFGLTFGKNERNYLRFGVNNILDRVPPMADESRGFYGLDANIGRYYYLDWRLRL